MTLEEGRKKGEREAIVANLDVLKDTEEFAQANITSKTMMLALKCGVSAQIITVKLKAYGIEL